MSERYCTVTFDWVTDYTVIQVHINSQGETEEEAIQHAADVLKANWGKQIQYFPVRPFREQLARTIARLLPIMTCV